MPQPQQCRRRCWEKRAEIQAQAGKTGPYRKPEAGGWPESPRAKPSGHCHSEGSARTPLPPEKNKQFLVFFFLHFIISNQVNNSIKREKSKEVFNAEGPDLGGGHEGHGPSAGSGGS